MDECEAILTSVKEELLKEEEKLKRDPIDCEHPVILELLSVKNEQKIAKIKEHFSEILETLGLDLDNDSLNRTPYRFAKMLVEELFTGLKGENFPKITTQKNTFSYHEMLLETNISINSVCEHHFMPIIGYCHIAYTPKDKVIGLSKLNRIAQYYARRPQVQERLTKQIHKKLTELLETEDVAVVVDAVHLCVRMRGIQDTESLTRTCSFDGCFNEMGHRKQALDSIPVLNTVKL